MYELFATCATGAEKVLAAELADLGAKRIRPLSSGVAFFGELEVAFRALLWLRTASRVLLILGRVPAADADQLYAGVLELPWEDHIPSAGSIAVDARGANAELRDTRFLAVKVKDAIVDRLRERSGERPSVDRDRPDVRINVSLRGNRATIAIDLSGEPLHRRGYRRAEGVEAPLKETLAATMILAAGWHQAKGRFISDEEQTFIDPLCGSGTLAIEAAMIYYNIAPGIFRDFWGCSGWLGYDIDVWDRLLEEADTRAELASVAEDERRAAGGKPLIFASDIDPIAVRAAEENARRAGLSGRIEFAVCDVAQSRPTVMDKAARGLIACNPPYGERLASASQLPAIYAALAGLWRSMPNLDLCVITPDERINVYLGLLPQVDIPTFNGPLETSIRVYRHASQLGDSDVVQSGAQTGVETGVDSDAEAVASSKLTSVAAIADITSIDDTLLDSPGVNTSQFVARLRKMAQHKGKWARRNNVDCYRVYDADLPDFAVAIDLYQGAGTDSGKRWLHIAEYAPPKDIDPYVATARLAAVLEYAPRILDVPTDAVFLKVRERARGGSQYADIAEANAKRSARAAAARKSAIHLVQEGGLTFEVDLAGRLDTGIFLDHRLTRDLLRSMAKVKDTLNLFAYTGTASVYMAAGRAKSVTTIDLSQTYLAWAERNMERNGFKGMRYQYEQTDVTRWVQEHRHDAEKYGLIFVDPPTFSNSTRMGERTWDVQRDHAELLIAVSRLLEPDGVAVFSCNLRSFKPNLETLAKAHVALKDITAQTIPEDFKRNQKIHHCYLVTREGNEG